MRGHEHVGTLDQGAAAALLHSLARNHALVDGNERLAWLATAVFLDLNGSPAALDDDDAFGLVHGRRDHDQAELEEITARLEVEWGRGAGQGGGKGPALGSRAGTGWPSCSAR